MRELSATLLAAQQSTSAIPAVRLTVSDSSMGTARLHFTRVYTGSEADYFHAAAMTGDGSLIRARITPPSDSRILYYQRVATPNESPDFSQWVNSGQYNCVVTAAAGVGAEVSILWIKSDRRIQRIVSADNGATWGAPELVDYAVSSAINGIGAAYKPNSDLGIFFADQSTLYTKLMAGGVWQARAAWDKPFGTTGDLSGVSAVYDGGWKLFVTGKDPAGNFKLWWLTLSDAGVWSALNEIATAPALSGYEYRHVSLAKPDVFRCFYIEKYTGQQAYSRPYSAQTVAGSAFSDGLWRESVPFNLVSDYGMNIVHHADYCWLCSPAGVWRENLQAAPIDLSPDILLLKQETGTTSGILTIELRNDDLSFSSPSSPLLPGGELFFEPGYMTAAGADTSAGQSFQITATERRRSGGKSSLVLYAEDGWSALENWRARQTFRWNQSASQKNVKDMLAFVLARGGLRLETVSASTTALSFYLDFSVSPGESGKAVVLKLLSFVPDVIFIEANTAYLVNPQPSDAACYSYGTSHAIMEGRYRQGEASPNSVRVAGSSILAEAFYWDSMDSGSERRISIADSRVGTLAQAEERGAAILGKSRINSISGGIRVMPNCGQQMHDVIEVSDARAGISNINRRVAGLELSFIPAKAEYRQQILLGGV